MLIVENIKLALTSLLSNKMRAFLTMLGIIIGIGSVIAIMTVSSSLTSSVSEGFQEMGANNITVGVKKTSTESETRSNGLRFGAISRNSQMEEDDLISDEMLESLRTTYADSIDAVAISESIGSGSITLSENSANITVMGINDEYFESSKISLLAGRHIKEADVTGNKKVIMVTDKVVEYLFGGNNEAALWSKLSINLNNKYTDYYIVGIYKYEESTFDSSSDDNITTTAYIPLSTGKEETHANDGYSQVTIVTKAGISSVSEFASQIETFFFPYYIANEDYEISATTMESVTESMNDMIQSISIAIAFIAGISLLVGGIGVMNIMLVSITERTREIGTRKALGARNSSIRLQFIVESMILCLIGGIFGIIVGFALGAIAAGVLGYSAAAPIGAIIISVGFSMIIGLFFGYYPANKAAKMDPIEALRYE